MTENAAPYASRRGIAGWLMFDWAAQPFYTLITTFVFAPFFASAVAADPASGQAQWGFATAAAGIVIALMSPVLGAIADESGRRKRWILVFSVPLVIGCALLWQARPGAPETVALTLFAFVLATIGAEFATLFNNAMIPHLVPPERVGRLSGTGWAIGYVGGLLSLVLTLGFLAASPETGKTLLGLSPVFGLDAAAREGDRASGPLSALWYIVFLTPMMLFTPDTPAKAALGDAVRAGLARLRATLGALDLRHGLGRFLLANMIYQDGLVALFAFGGIYAAGTFGWETIEIGIFGILLTITGTLGAWIGGKLDDRLGPKPVILGALVVLSLVAIAILSITRESILFGIAVEGPRPGDGLFASTPERLYVALGLLIGLVAGPMQAGSRSALVRLTPRAQAGQFFGLFALAGKVTSFMGPLLVGLVTTLTASQRPGMAVLLAFFVIGAWLLKGVAITRS